GRKELLMTWATRQAASPQARSERTGIGILGASGYTGLELLRLLGSHPMAEIVAASSRQYAGQPIGRACAAFARATLVLDDDPDDPAAWVERGVEVVFSALPHGAFAARARRV